MLMINLTSKLYKILRFSPMLKLKTDPIEGWKIRSIQIKIIPHFQRKNYDYYDYTNCAYGKNVTGKYVMCYK